MLTDVRVAVLFLTVLPIPPPPQVTPEQIGRSVRYFPLVGLGLGGLLVLVQRLLSPYVTPDVLAWILVVLLLGLTGMLHFDGFVDCCDGLLAARDPETRLIILQDSRVGSFALAGGWALLMAKWLALSHLHGASLTLSLGLGSLVGRWAMLLAVVWFPYGRADGLGSHYQAATPKSVVLIASILVGGIVILLSGGRAWPLLIGIPLLTWGLGRWILTRLPQGLTGDCYGLIVEVMELVSWVSVGWLWA
ncbi:MAG: adenosylcobinamide-GDP ribazoletransferase [Synechococcales cyanobacterium]